MDLSKSTAIITGAAHRVGKGIALSLASQGCNIIVHYGKSAEKAVETVKEIKDLGVEAYSYSADLNIPAEIEQFVNEINNNFSYQILVNSAASFVKGDFESTTLQQWDHSMNINVRAPFLLSQYSAKILKKGNDSLIVNISDLSGKYVWQNFTAHGVSKAALIHLTKYTAKALSPIVRVNAIVPGPILPPPDFSETDSKWQNMINNIPLKKSGDPLQIGQTVVFLANNEFITGAVINVDGGEGLVGPKNH